MNYDTIVLWLIITMVVIINIMIFLFGRLMYTVRKRLDMIDQILRDLEDFQVYMEARY